MRNLVRIVPFLLLAVSVTAALPMAAQQPGRPLTLETLFDPAFSPPAPSQVRWAPGGRRMSYLFGDGNGGRALWTLDIETGEKQILVSAEALKNLAPPVSDVAGSDRRLTRLTRGGDFSAYQWMPDGKRILFTSAGRLFLFELSTGESKPLAGSMDGIGDAELSPDGNQVAFIRDHDLWVAPTEGGGPRRLTTGGSDDVLHGGVAWVYWEEFGVRRGYAWSPDSQRIAYYEMDERDVPTYPITEQVSVQATADFQRYPKPGDPNPRVRAGVIGIEGGDTVWIDRAAEYIPRIGWADAETLTVQLMNRGQDRLELLFVEAATGKSRGVVTQKDEHWVNVTDDLSFLGDGTFLWTSEHTGFRHIYRYDRTGKETGQLTSGEWEVGGITAVDEDGGWVYYTSNEGNETGSNLWRVKLTGGERDQVTPGHGSHRVNLSPGARALYDSYSSLEEMSRAIVRNLATGKEYEMSSPPDISAYGFVTPEEKVIQSPDGAAIRLLLMKPARLERKRKYPVLVYVYGMAGVPTIRDSWGGRRYLFHQFLVQNGYVVAHIDDRSSALRGHKYSILADHDLGPLALKDVTAGVEYLKSQPYVDGDNIAVWGWSGGGFSTSFHLTHSTLFKAGIAGAPVTDWRLYDSIYTERYMERPQDQPEAYDRTSAVKAAENLHGRLLLIHGTHDDNVHPQNTIQFIDALVKAGKQYDLLLYPNKTHGITGRAHNMHLYTRIFDFLEANLK